MENLPKPLTPAEKKQYLLAKYTKRDYKVEDLIPKFAVYFNPAIETITEWKLLCVCDNRDQALKEILWRKKYHETNDGDLVIDNDSRFETWRDETKNVDIYGKTYEPGQELMHLDYNSSSNPIQVIANSTPVQQNKTGFRGMGYYAFELNYTGFYKIEEFFEV